MTSGTTIGQAYVQILPSMEGVSAAINKGCSTQMSESGETLGKGLGSALVSTVTKIIAAAGIGKIFSNAISEGGNLQQSLGGVETLFGEAADTVKENAKNAWKNVGLSANEYMEQTTSFAASLVSSLDGDTAAAASLADTAMQDMSDNANKMGTDMTAITNAYQGFAKQNYTMLDNLKLGYGGTQDEMKRLVKEAAEMTSVQKELGVTVDSESLSFDNIVSAIHVVQANMGILGTTSEEAATTLTGSVSMMKASWTDLLGQMALGNDLTEPLQNLVTSVVSFGNNLIPMIGNIIGSVGDLIINTDWNSVISAGLGNLDEGVQSTISSIDWSSIPQQILGAITNFGDTSLTLIESAENLLESTDWSQLSDVVTECIDTALDLGTGAITSLATVGNNLLNNISQGFIDGIPSFISNILPMITESVTSFGNAGLNLVETVVNILENTDWSSLAETVVECIGTALDLGTGAITSLATVGAEFLNNISQGFVTGIPTFLANVLPMITEFTGSLRENAGTIVDAGLNLMQNLAQGLINSIPVLVENVPQIIINIAGIINDNAPKILATGATIIVNLAQGIIKSIPVIIANMPKIIEAIVSVITAFNWLNLGKTIVTGISNAVKTLPSTLKNIVTSATNGVKNAFTNAGIVNVVKGIFSKIPTVAKSLLTNALNIIKGFPGKFISALKFSWSLPTLKVPHIHVDGGEAPWGIGGLGHLPSFNVTWAAKGGILDKAALIGAGEAGHEALLPLDRNTSWMDKLADKVNNRSDKTTTINVSMTVNGSDDPEDWGEKFISSLKRQVRMN